MGGENDDGGYSALAPSLQRKIDDAFDTAAVSSTRLSSSSKRRKLHDHRHSSLHPPTSTVSSQPPSGGFILGDPSPAAGGLLREHSPLAGGFLPEPSRDSDPDPDDVPTHIPLFLIPTALQILDLQPDDDDVLSVFRSAASGWNRGSSGDHPQEGVVSRKDWRAVCATLLDAGFVDGDDDEDDEDVVDVDALMSDANAPVANTDERSDSGEEYVQAGSDSSVGEDQDSDDEYREGGFLGNTYSGRKMRGKGFSKRGQGGRGVGRKAGIMASGVGSGRGEVEDGLSEEQKRECRAAFALFVGEGGEESLEKARIGVEDMRRAAGLVQEKLSRDEVVEMLEAFSSSGDKSMGLDDFARMMVATKMV